MSWLYREKPVFLALLPTAYNSPSLLHLSLGEVVLAIIAKWTSEQGGLNFGYMCAASNEGLEEEVNKEEAAAADKFFSPLHRFSSSSPSTTIATDDSQSFVCSPFQSLHDQTHSNRWKRLAGPITAQTITWASSSSANERSSLHQKSPDDLFSTSPPLPFSLSNVNSFTPHHNFMATPNRSRLRPITPRSLKKIFPRLRIKELAGMMGVSDQGNHNSSPATMRGHRDVFPDATKAGDDPLEAANHHRNRSRDALREMNNYPLGLAASTSANSNHTGALSPSLSNDDSLSQVSNRTMLYPTIKVRPEYDTIYRKERAADQSRQNVVCVVSVEVPSKRNASTAEEEEQLWFQKANQRGLATIKDNDDEVIQENGHVDEDVDEKEEGKMTSPAGVEEEEKYEEAMTAADRKSITSEEEEEGFSFGATPAAIDPESMDPFANVVEDLRRRITDWKGHTVDRFGPLVLYDFLGVRQENVVREFYVYLFKEALLCVTEEKKKEKGLARLMGSDKSNGGNHHFEDLQNSGGTSSGSNGRQNKPALKLKGRIWLRHIRRCQETESEGAGHCLSIKLDDDSLDQFVLCLKDKGHRELWKEKMTELLEQHKKPKDFVVGSLSNKKAMQELPTPPMQHGDVFEDAKTHNINRRLTTASTSGHSLQSGKSGSNNLTSPTTTFASPRLNHSTTNPLISPRVGPSGSLGEQSKLHPNHRPTHTSLIPGLPQHQQWSSSGGLDPNLPHPDLLPHTPIDLVIMISVPSFFGQSSSLSSSTLSSSAALKLRLIRSTLDFVINHLGPSDRIALVAYNVGVDGLVRRTSLLNASKPQSMEKLEQFVDTIGRPWEGPGVDPFQEDMDRLGGSSDRTDTVTAVNIGFDIVLQRKSKNPVTGMILINDTSDAPRRGQMDLVMARAEAANVPVHCFGFGKSHDPSSLWLISNHTRGSYTFVKEWYQLRECISGCIGSIMSVALTEVKLHISVPSDNFFKVRKVAGPSGAIISSTGKDVDIELGELRFGDCKELFVELELDFNSLMKSMQRDSGKRNASGTKKSISDHYEKGSATDDFMQRLGLQGLSISHEEQISPHNSYDQTTMEGNFIEEVAVLEVDCGCKDPSMGSGTNRIPNPGVLTLEVDGSSTDPISELSAGSGGLATALADPVVTRRRLEILVSDMITRCLLLVSKRNHNQALTILLETRRIVDTVLQAIPVEHLDSSGRHASLSLMSHHQQSSSLRSSQAKKQKEILHRKTALSLLAILEDLDVLIDGLETNQNVSFERTERNFGAQQAMALRDQKAWTSRTDTEWQYHRGIDNAPPFAALAAAHAVSGRAR